MKQSSMLLDANLYGLRRHYSIRQNSHLTGEDALLNTFHQNQAIREAAKHLTQILNTGQPPPDALITTILILASYNSAGPQWETWTGSGDFQQLEKSIDHREALHLLVRQKGGLAAIEDQGIANLIFM